MASFLTARQPNQLTIPKWNEMGVYLLGSCPTLICQIGRRLGSVFEPLLQK